MEPEFVEGERATRLKVLAFVSVLLLILLLEHLTRPDAALRTADPVQAFRKLADHLFIVALTATCFFAVSSIYLFRLATKVKQSGQWPPPGMRMAVRTKVLRGRRARWNAILLFVLAGVFMVPGPALFFAWHSISNLHKQIQPVPRNGAADLRHWADLRQGAVVLRPGGARVSRVRVGILHAPDFVRGDRPHAA